MPRLNRTALLLTTLIAGAVPAATASAETVLRLVPSHFDALTENFNPYNYSGPAYLSQDFAYEPLWIYNVWHPDQDFPMLATAYEVAPDLKSVTYHLRDGVKWSDGEVFNADDVIFTYNYNKAHPDFPIGFDLFNAEAGSGNVTGAEKIDDLTVRFTLDHPDALAHQNLGIVFPLPEHIWSKIDDPKNYAASPIVATGPWTEVKEFSRSSVKLCRNPLYRAVDDNKIDCLQFPQLSSNEQVIAALTVGDVDWAGDGITDPEITYTPQSEFNKYWLPPEGNVNLQLNTTRKPFDNLEFRKAMSMAIDRDTLVEISTFGLTTPTQFPIGIGELYKDWVDPAKLEAFRPLMAYDPDAAKAVLDAAGFVDADGDGWRDEPDGTPINFKMAVPSGWTDWVNSLQTISENLQDVSINAEMSTPEEGAWFDAIPNGDFDVYIMWTEVGATPYTSYKAMFTPASMIPGQIREQAMHQMRIPAIEAALDEIAATSDTAAQRAGIEKIEALVAENLPVISLFSNPSWYEYSTRNFTGWVDASDPRYRPMMNGGIHERVIHALSLQPTGN